MKKIEWETIPGSNLRRSRTPFGWLVTPDNSDRNNRASLTFVSDPGGRWLAEDKEDDESETFDDTDTDEAISQVYYNDEENPNE